MLKFFKHHMESIDGIAIYPIISLIIFFAFFIILFFWVATAKKQYIDEVSKIPFDTTNNDNLTL